MTASIGVYPYSQGVHEALFERTYWLSNRDILARQMFIPVESILEDVRERRCSDFIGRERYRQWQELVEEDIGVWWDWPSWNDMKKDGYDITYFADEFYCDGCSEWEIYCDDDLLYEVPDALDPEVDIDDVQKYIRARGKAQFIAVMIPGESRFYILYSTRVENRRPITWMNQEPDLTAEEVLCGAWEEGEGGKWPTYLLPLLLEQEALESDEQYEAEYEATYGQQEVG